MWTRFLERLVTFCVRHAFGVIVAGVLLGVGAAYYTSQNFAMDSNANNLISKDVPWRRNSLAFDAAFPQQDNLTLVVIDGVTPERAQEAAVALESALATRKALFPVVRDLQGSSFFAHNGLLYLPLGEVRSTTQELIQSQPFLGPLAADPSLRGIMTGLDTALLGVENGQTKLDQLMPALTVFSDTLESSAAGHPAYLSWQSLITGHKPDARETRRLIEVRTVLDYGALEPGAAAATALRGIAEGLGLTPEQGVRVRLTGPVPLSDEEFATLTERAWLMAVLMAGAILLMLWLAVRSAKIVFAILMTLAIGVVMSLAVGLAVAGTFNVISIAFIPLIIGIGVDFGIQYSVRYRAERHAAGTLDLALMRAVQGVGMSLTLAAVATATCFFSFVPTDYLGLAQLGFVAGAGMLVTFFLSVSLLPALLKAMRPKGEASEIGYKSLAPLDAFLVRNRHAIVLGAGAVAILCAGLLPFIQFDANPFHLRSTRVESMATLNDLMKDPETTPDTIDVLTPSLQAADAMARRLIAIPDVREARTLSSFVPDGQAEKLALIADASMLLDTTLNPFEAMAAPTMAETIQAMDATKQKLRGLAGPTATPANNAARRMAAALDAVEHGGSAALARADAAFIPGLKIMLERLRNALSPQMVTLESLPAELRQDWIASDGRARVQGFPKADFNDDAAVDRFAAAVSAMVPEATGSAISTRESGRTIVRAFIEAGILSFLAMAVLLAIAFHRVLDVVLALATLIFIGLLTFATCVVIGLRLNFANIIVLPLLFGVGVAFTIYFLMSWRQGGHDFLQSSLARAVFFSAFATATGFGTLWLSSHPGTASMGELLMISLGWTLFTTFFVLPALLESVSAVSSVSLSRRCDKSP
ncbi:MAG TPA: MMPL family transporter [Micropepsaceae bacterium]|nr:MMPL family transporter [Micropepsaceae bacterium]